MSQLLGYFYALPIGIMFFLVLWWVRESGVTYGKPVSWGDAEKVIEKRDAELGQGV